MIVADIRFGNGADNALIKTLFDKQLAYRLASYGGWNTAGNSLGFALAQGLLHKQLTPEARENLLNVRYLDDWLISECAHANLSAAYLPNYCQQRTE